MPFVPASTVAFWASTTSFTGGTPPPGYVEAAERIVSGKAAEYLGWLEARS